MNKYIRKILFKIADITNCGTPDIQMKNDAKIAKIKGLPNPLSKEDRVVLKKYIDIVSPK